MAHIEALPPVRLQKGGKRLRATSIVTKPRKAGKGRQRNRVHRGNAAPSTVGHLVPQWMIDRRDVDAEIRERERNRGGWLSDRLKTAIHSAA